MPNVTAVTGFILMGLSDIHKLQTLCGVLFLVIYLEILMSNLLIIVLITVDLKLQTPMYFFLKNLSLLDVCLVSVTIPNFFIHKISISILGCAFQIFFMAFLGSGEVFILTTMSYDRYVAICSPLHYEVIMSNVISVVMMSVSWGTGLLFGSMYTAGTFFMLFCDSNVIPQVFCDVPSLLRISCSGSLMIIYVSLGIGVFLGMSCFICVVISYFYIIVTVLKIPTTKGQSKAFATCLPHLTVFSVFIAIACFVYLKPPLKSASLTDRLFSVLYTVLPPTLNPVIYSLRNNDVDSALKRLLQKSLLKRLPSLNTSKCLRVT